jgi:lipopolysaccharide export system protein LptA
MNRKLTTFALSILLIFGLATVIYAAASKPVELSADTIEYDSVQGIMTAQGSVKLIRDKAVLTGISAKYNVKTKEAVITGGVRVVREDSTLTANEVTSYNDNYLVAVGQAVLVKGDSTVAGPKIEHWVDKQYSLVNDGAKLTMTDGVMIADKLEFFHKDSRAVGTGHVHIVSDTRHLDATAEQATYFGAKTDKHSVVLSGNARAVQDGNVLTGKTMTIYLDDKAMDAQGRPQLVVKPQ